jgi:hypothetical protein
MKILIMFLLIAASPALLISLTWLLTIGSFNLLNALHSPVTLVFTVISIICAAFAVIAVFVEDCK